MKEYGWITPLKETTQRHGRGIVWECECRCGNLVYRTLVELRRAIKKNKSGVTSCGCARQRDYTGLKNGELTAIKKLYKNDQREMVWEFECSCGRHIERVAADIARGDGSLHCGCKPRPTGKDSHSYKGYEGLTGTYWARLKYNAKKRHLTFTIKKDYTWNLLEEQNMKCAISGYDISEGTDASLDRIDSAKGYIEGNVWWVHKHINWMKRDHSMEYFIKLCGDVYERHAEKFE